MNERIELLAPARDLGGGLAAIDCGADAVYIGAPRFGARETAGNSLEDIAALARHAHRYWARVYLTLNTLLRDDEISAAVDMAWQAHEAGIDGLIIQDAGRQGLFLPSVWAQVPHPMRFLRQLKIKAGLRPDHWSRTFQAFRFSTESFG